MEPNVRREEEIEIDLKELFFYLLGKAVKIAAVGFVFAVIALFWTKLFITPLYTSQTSLYVLNRQTTENITNSDLQSSTYLTRDYVQLIKSRTVVDTVIEKMNLDYSSQKLLSAMEVVAIDDTRIISIRVTDPSPEQAQKMANEIRLAAAEQIQRVMKTEAVNVVDEANLPLKKSSPSTSKNVVLAGAAGVFLMAAWYCVLFLMNDKISTADDVERYLGLGILGEMPLDEKEMKHRKIEKKKRKRGKSKKTVRK